MGSSLGQFRSNSFNDSLLLMAITFLGMMHIVISLVTEGKCRNIKDSSTANNEYYHPMWKPDSYLMVDNS